MGMGAVSVITLPLTVFR